MTVRPTRSDTRLGLSPPLSVLIEDIAGLFHRLLPLSDPEAEQARTDFVSDPNFEYDRTELADLLTAERDQLETRIVDSHASGYSHGFWIFSSTRPHSPQLPSVAYV
jgi:hypothetical protein